MKLMKLMRLLCFASILLSYMACALDDDIFTWQEMIIVTKPIKRLCGFSPGELLQECKNKDKLQNDSTAKYLYDCSPPPIPFLEFEACLVPTLSDGRIAAVTLIKKFDWPHEAAKEFKKVRERLNAYFQVDNTQLTPLQERLGYITIYACKESDVVMTLFTKESKLILLLSTPKLNELLTQEQEQRAHHKFMENDAAALE